MPGQSVPARNAFPAQIAGIEQQLAQLNVWIRNWQTELHNSCMLASLTAAYSLPVSYTSVPLDTAIQDPGNHFANHGYTASKPGFYHVDAQLAMHYENSPQAAIIGIALDGVEELRGDRVTLRGGVGGDAFDMSVSGIVKVAKAGVVITVIAFNGGGNVMPLELGPPSLNRLSVHLVG